MLLQAADFIAGTLARCYDETVRSAQANAFIHVLKPNISFIRYWPEPFSSYTTSLAEQSETYNKELAELSINLAQDFINRHTRIGSPQHQDQLSCLHYLVLYFRTISADKYISSRELIQHIEGQRGSSISLHYFQARVIAPLRDAGVLIASSSKGYKLPASEQDLYSFINHSNTIIQPMLPESKSAETGSCWPLTGNWIC
ncbi:hypothetical protein BWI97_25880 [Siphonobacter sp. BAB-5405]|nr:hypothetical protein BWI97_25880 [Siphonobacter sp. BAB-5405]